MKKHDLPNCPWWPNFPSNYAQFHVLQHQQVICPQLKELELQKSNWDSPFHHMEKKMEDCYRYMHGKRYVYIQEQKKSCIKKKFRVIEWKKRLHEKTKKNKNKNKKPLSIPLTVANHNDPIRKMLAIKKTQVRNNKWRRSNITELFLLNISSKRYFRKLTKSSPVLMNFSVSTNSHSPCSTNSGSDHTALRSLNLRKVKLPTANAIRYVYK